MAENKKNISIDSGLYDEIKEFCALNSLKINDFVSSILKKEILLQKYGDTPFTNYREEESVKEEPPKIYEREEVKEVQEEVIVVEEEEIKPREMQRNDIEIKDNTEKNIMSKKRRLK